ncbi:hypothetical protein GCM10009767_13740 [Kocuria aegyptia]|uniref:Uncharacterized protein n=1 Tax=Kocuria aegyptia TaxID=330943 RepID=A0ABN2KGP9_9MICC
MALMTVYVEFLPYPCGPEDMIRTVSTVIFDEISPLELGVSYEAWGIDNSYSWLRWRSAR